MFARILTATGSLDGPDPVVLAAIRLAGRWSASVRVLHILEGPASGSATSDALIWAERRLVELYRPFQSGSSEVETVAAAGCPWEEILAAEKAMAADLAVLGPHRRSRSGSPGVRPMGRLGSTAAGLLTRDGCPVMILGRSPSLLSGVFGAILVGIDFSVACESALRFAGRLAKHEGAHLYPVHMVPVPPYPKYTQADFEADRRNALDRLSRFCEATLGVVSEPCSVVGGGDPASALLEAAERVHADLVVLGSHAREIDGKWYPGSVVEKVGTRSACPVAVLNGPKALRPWAAERRRAERPQKTLDRSIRVFSRRSENPTRGRRA